MKTLKHLVTAIVVLFSAVTFAQSGKTKTITMTQVKGDFIVKGLELSAGDYVFDIENQGVDHEVGFVLVPVKNGKEGEHIKEAYVKKTVKTNKTESSSVVSLTPGEYVYFCPLNPTPKYKITVVR